MRTLLAALLFATLPAWAGTPAPAPSLPAMPTAEVCPLPGQPVHLAQLACCKGNKGVCGCRAGKIVCCDNSTSKDPDCACNRDEGVVN